MNNQKISLLHILVVLLVIAIVYVLFFRPPNSAYQINSEPSVNLELNVEPSVDVFSTEKKHGVVGYIGYGALVLSVPDWVAEHWKSVPSSDGRTFRFTPKEEMPVRDFSDIVIILSTTTETHNAATLYERNKNLATASEIFLSEVDEGRIYFIETQDQGIVFNTYYIDGNGKTAEFVFHADGSTYAQYAPKIREFVRGFGKGESPRG